MQLLAAIAELRHHDEEQEHFAEVLDSITARRKREILEDVVKEHLLRVEEAGMMLAVSLSLHHNS